jgi:cytochrome c55X
MPNFNSSALADCTLIAAGVVVITGIAILIVYSAHTRQLIPSERTDRAYNAAIETRPVYIEENPAEVTNKRQSELRYFVEQNCPACHGIRLTGSIGPALSKANLQYLSVNAVTLTILYGLPEKGMPPWEAQLSEKDAHWIAKFLKRGGII